MDSLAVPFSRLLGLRRTAEGRLMLPFSDATLNHLGTVHASAQFALAETAAGDDLGAIFPELVGKVVPVVRDARAKFRTPATGDLIAFPEISADMRATFAERLAARGRAAITVRVELRMPDGTLTCQAEYDWFIQRIEKN